MIDARRLHNWLGPKWQFSKWMQHRIEDYGFEDGTDFYRSSTKTGGRPRTDYLLTLDTAKELAMVERTDIGRQTRRYFIEMEKAAVKMAADHVEAGSFGSTQRTSASASVCRSPLAFPRTSWG